MAEVRSAQAKPKVEPRHIHAIRIEIGKDGGHVVHHEMRGGGPEDFGGGEEQPHIFGKEDGEKLMAHIQKHAKVGGKIKGKEDKDELESEDEGPSKGNKKHKERENASTETDDNEGEEEEKEEEDE